ncbi:TetR/AcrR family transcriptional regulator [Fuscibacter oryzae]|uniref:TetR/AcrR family transcriptional regulator n=1 Tax=Fuscibacter oryzae TaxID=2803939 RepID=A0A8J7MW97_9RHOB|nr:TetR/AcrR family transcriptional regulator [Fuscibacter oryzae]MBL4929783.1 TetR/AcrR family transcriptional regulator [Fuscibacter oryzae]
MSDSDHSPEDPKDAAILRSAFVAFAQYGLRRTSMADIAKGAGMSRPALYLHYSGKEDIFKALVRIHFARSETAVAKALAIAASPAETLLAAIRAIDGDAVEVMMNSPHADEILSSDTPFNQAEVQDSYSRITASIARWIAEGVLAGRLTLEGLGATAEEVAATIMAAKFGIKGASKDFAAYQAGVIRLTAVFGKALGR